VAVGLLSGCATWDRANIWLYERVNSENLAEETSAD